MRIKLHQDIRISLYPTYNTAFRCTFALLIQNIKSCLVLWCSKTLTKDWNIFVKFLDEVAPLVFKNNLRMIVGSKSEKFKNIEIQKTIRYSYKAIESIVLLFINVTLVHQITSIQKKQYYIVVTRPIPAQALITTSQVFHSFYYGMPQPTTWQQNKRQDKGGVAAELTEHIYAERILKEGGK